MSTFSRFFSKKTLVYLAATFALTGIASAASALLSGAMIYALPIAFDFQSTYQYDASINRIGELQGRIDALASVEPRVLLARLKEATQIPSGCDGPTLVLDVSVRAMVYSGSDVLHEFLRHAEERGVGKECGSFSISISPPRHLLYVFGLLALFVLAFVWRSRHGRHTFRVNWSDWTPRIGWIGALRWGVVGGAASIILVVAMTWLLALMGVANDRNSNWSAIADGGLLLPLAVIAAPIFEEFLFRAWMMERLTRVLPTTLALLISTVSFAAIHLPQSAMEGAQLLLGGLVLGAIWWRFRSLLACIVAHAVYNACAFAMYWFQIDT